MKVHIVVRHDFGEVHNDNCSCLEIEEVFLDSSKAEAHRDELQAEIGTMGKCWIVEKEVRD